jgi:hypothetical protein
MTEYPKIVFKLFVIFPSNVWQSSSSELLWNKKSKQISERGLAGCTVRYIIGIEHWMSDFKNPPRIAASPTVNTILINLPIFDEGVTRDHFCYITPCQKVFSPLAHDRGQNGSG